jgi:hypothetical protein
MYIFENMFKFPSAAQNSDPDAKIVSFYELVLIFFFFWVKTEIHERFVCKIIILFY